VSDSARRALVIVPTYNERENIERLVEAVLAAEPGADLLIVDDTSPDGTGEIADRLAILHPDRIRVLHRATKDGIGPAYLAGFRAGLERDYSTYVSMDADFSHSPNDLPMLLEALTDADLAIGSRYVRGGETIGWPFYRKVISRLGGWYAQRVLSVHVSDLTSGFKAYSRPVIESLLEIGIRADGYGFQIETVYRALGRGYRVVEVPIVFHDRTAGRSKLSRMIVLEAMFMVWRLRFSRSGNPSPH
jgi:dolichol-phosphate mannosyltransferase